MPNRRSRYTPEFRAEAVKLYRSVKQEKSMRQVATELGISNETLRSWIKQEDIDGGRREGLSSEERQELSRLRRENRVLQEEREILKNAALSSTGRCNTGHGSVSIGRWLIGTDGTTGVDGRAEERVVGAVEGWGVAQRYRQGAQQTARLNPRGRCIERGVRPRGKTPLAQSAVA